MFNSIDTKVYSPINGVIGSLKNVEDKMFKNEMLGMTFALDAKDNKIYAPIKGIVTALYPTNHAIGITRKDGLEVLLHIGIDTCNLSGKGFSTLTKLGDDVDKHQALIEFDKSYIEDSGLSSVVFLILTNCKQFNVEVEYKEHMIAIKDVLVHAKAKKD